jgi:CDGSH-type Zn-finger protein
MAQLVVRCSGAATPSSWEQRLYVMQLTDWLCAGCDDSSESTQSLQRKNMTKREHPKFKIEVTKDGPYLVSGGLPLAEQWIVTNAEGESLDYREGKKYPARAQYALCRCGHSGTKPFCDGTHEKVAFDGTETASRRPYAEQEVAIGAPTLVLTDVENLCAFARFCDPGGQVWNLVAQADDPETRRLVEHEAGHCPSGRLVVRDRKTNEAIEPKFEPSIGLIEDTARQVRGPIWARGGIPIISAEGETYEVRNRVTVCRCGRSKNKPFCDGSHAA